MFLAGKPCGKLGRLCESFINLTTGGKDARAGENPVIVGLDGSHIGRPLSEGRLLKKIKRYTMDWLISACSILFGGGVAWLVFWKQSKNKLDGEAKQAQAQAQQMALEAVKTLQEVYDRTISRLNTDRDELQGYVTKLKDEREELLARIDKTEAVVRNLQDDVSSNRRAVEALRPFLCYDLTCRKRVRKEEVRNREK